MQILAKVMVGTHVKQVDDSFKGHQTKIHTIWKLPNWKK
jgi:hypothetical protein